MHRQGRRRQHVVCRSAETCINLVGSFTLLSSNLCGALDFSKVDDVCGRLETRDVLLKKAAHDARCAHRGPGARPRIELSEGLFSRLRGA